MSDVHESKPFFGDSLEYTGERMVPEKSDPATFWEHVYRYRFAATFAAGKDVLDIACGEGYGTAALTRSGARSVIGVDISESSCEHARRRYGIDARQGDAERINLPDGSIDLIVSFETIEHVPNPASFIAECRRLLRPKGTLLISTPNPSVYDERCPNNPYHCSELSEPEFLALLSRNFSIRALLEQTRTTPVDRLQKLLSVVSCRLAFWSTQFIRRQMWRHLSEPGIQRYRGTIIETILSKHAPMAALVDPYFIRPRAATDPLEGMYLVAVASPRADNVSR